MDIGPKTGPALVSPFTCSGESTCTDASTHERPFRDSTRSRQLSSGSAWIASQRRYSPEFLSAHAPAGQAIRVQHFASDGSTETLLRVNYNFFWQLSYKLLYPRELSAGTRLQAVAWFDNSRNNPHNPDPDSAVRWGEQTSDEMMVGFFDVAVPAGTDKWQFFRRAQ